ncbi:hypothetical protein FRC03_012529 [Tulasnella sp. 419]|nr:hypothetical protein FRC03_012529 [Tulasnella sp. 419]
MDLPQLLPPQHLVAMATPVTPSTPLSKSETYTNEAVKSNDYFSEKPIPVPPKSPSYGTHKSLGAVAWFPLVTILVWSFGMGTLLLAWLLVKRIPPPGGASSNIFDGYLVIDEGNKTGSIETLDGQEILESRLTGVLIITAISHFSSIAVVPLMALGAFYVAERWLDDQAQSKVGPTPLQFGLVVTMCSSGTWDSFFATLRYLFRCWKTQSPAAPVKVSPLVYMAFVITGIVVALHYSLVVTDLLLTAEVGSAYYVPARRIVIDNSSLGSQLGTQYSAERNYFWEALSDYVRAKIEDGPFGTETHENPPQSLLKLVAYREAGLKAIVGSSSTSYISMIDTSISTSYEDTSSIAVIVRPPSGVPPQWSWTASTIGMTARCQPAPCNGMSGNTTIFCPQAEKSNVTWHSIPLPSFDYISTLITDIPIIGYRRSGEMIEFPLTASMPQSPSQVENPTYFAIRLWLESDSAWAKVRDETEFGSIFQEGNNYDFYHGLCEVTMYDVKISFNGTSTIDNNYAPQNIDSQYSLTSAPTPMSSDQVTQVLSPLMADLAQSSSFYRSGIMPALQSALLRDASSPRFTSKLSSEFAKYSMASISAMYVAGVPAADVVDNVAKLVSRYPLTRTLAYIGVVYAHGLLGIILFAGMGRKSSRTIVVDEEVRQVNWYGVPVEKKQKPIQELLLVQSRLSDPLTIIAEHFLEPKSENPNLSKITTPAGALSAQDDAIRMFDMEGPETKRVDVGIIDRQEGERWFGLRHRRKDVLIVDSGNEVGKGV